MRHGARLLGKAFEKALFVHHLRREDFDRHKTIQLGWYRLVDGRS